MSFQLILNPHGRLLLDAIPGTVPALEPAFAQGSALGLFALASQRREVAAWTAETVFWREFADRFLTTLAHAPERITPSGPELPEVPLPPDLGFELALRIPAMPGAEYASPELFRSLWQELEVVAHSEVKRAGGLKPWLIQINPALNLLGKVTFHLAENKRSPETPFAFMATYTHRLSAQEKPVHLPLARALQEYAGAKNQAALRSLLEPVQRAADQCPWARELLETRRLFQPQAWVPGQAYAFLREIPTLEASGITVRIPNWWKNGRGPRPQIRVRIGGNQSAGLDVASLLKFTVESSLGGETLSPEEWAAVLASDSGLVPLRGQWVEVDRAKLQEALDHWRTVEAGSAGEGISFLEGMRLLAGVKLGTGVTADSAEDSGADWSEVVASGGLQVLLDQLREPDQSAPFDLSQHLHARLRPYQETGVKWLWFLQSLGLGACLADDMGLGKTVQLIALLLQLKHRESPAARRPKTAGKVDSAPNAPSLLLVPASLLANWKHELARFAPSLKVDFAHPSEATNDAWRDPQTANEFLAGKDVILTTYGQTLRLEWLATRRWRLLVLDEAQAIKNPGSRQTRAVKKLQAEARIALSGTPVENRLGDLWSLYDFLNPGLLGGATEFTRYVKSLQAAARPDFGPLRQLVRPYLLRRLKTDRRIISDLPDKTELTSWCSLGKRQAALYTHSVRELAEKLEDSSPGIQRRGLVLAFLMRFKQICNHPSHWLADGAYAPGESGKFQRLNELTEEIASRQEKVLIFTQFRELTEPLAAYLKVIFGRPGLILDGGTPVKARQNLVASFQRDDGPPFFVLSLKAGGTGLNLTAASQVIHFDRWWNPAIEDQATDRAFRIGQKRNVLVHKFVCRGTVEERIDALIREKKNLAAAVLGAEGGAEKLLTEMSNEELLGFVALDLKSAGTE